MSVFVTVPTEPAVTLWTYTSTVALKPGPWFRAKAGTSSAVSARLGSRAASPRAESRVVVGVSDVLNGLQSQLALTACRQTRWR
jgi:hypothetical protein